MKAIILVGGFGTRLRPLTLDTPKQMLPVLDQTMIERVIRWLQPHGVTDAILSLGFKPEPFMEAYPDGTCAGVTLHYAVEPEPLDTAGAMRFAAEHAGIDERFIMINGDVLTDIDVAAMWAFHDKAGAEGTLALTPVEDPSRFGVVPIDADGRVEAFIEKPPRDEAPSNWINAGCGIFEPSVLGRIPTGRKVSIERETYPQLVGDRTLFAVQCDAYWVDAGTPEAYLQAQLDLCDGVRGPAEQAIATSATVADGADVTHSILLDGAAVAAGAIVRDSLLMAGATVEAGAQVLGSIVGPGSTIGADSVLADLTVTGHDVTIDPGTKLAGARVPSSD